MAGCLGLLLPINIDDPVSVREVRCGQPFSLKLNEYAAPMDRQNATQYGRTATDFVGDCKAAATFREAWGVPVAIAGGVLLAGALLVRSPSASSHTKREPGID
ncbi:hypothetical protein AU187_03735 [Mycobacterium sp. IS-1556]|nr:hypothetical protein AU187_03735 [Mycobacterium sp. IS-1556]